MRALPPPAPRAAALALAAAVLAAAPGCGDRLAGADYRGVPLATVSGSMVPTPETDLRGPVRLALVWYPQWLAADDPGAGEATAVAIVTEDVRAEGTFPADFRFPILRPPPVAAIAPLAPGLAGRGSFGVLLAYQDLDGDGRLAAIPRDGAPVDRVVASSLLGDPANTFALVYVDAEQPPSTGLAKGLNLVRAVNDAAEVVPLATRMRLSLTAGGPIYDAFVCTAGWLTFLFTEVCGLPSGAEGAGPPGFALDGRVALDGARLEIELSVTSLGRTHPDASVTVNGRVIPYSPGRGTFHLSEEGSTLVRPGGSFIASASAEGAAVGRLFAMPGEFEVTAPAEAGTVSASQPLDLRWTPSAGSTSYFAGFEALPAGYATITEPGALSIALDTANAGLGPATAFVESRVDPVDGALFVTTALVRRRSFFFAP